MGKRVLLTGATGFVGTRVYPELVARGHDVRCASRRPEAARARFPERAWVELDMNQPELIASAVAGVEVIYYLVHAMADGPGYAERELQAARTLVELAAAAGVERIVYLGGIQPSGAASKHLDSRLQTGAALRGGAVPCVELRAGMIIGAGSASWKICRDLAARLPFMLLPRWLSTRSQPVAIEDVVTALVEAGTIECDGSVVYDLPGPEVITAVGILMRIARLRGTAPWTVSVPILTPKLSSYWLKLVSGVDFVIARELVEGLKADLLATEPPFWDRIPDHRLTPFDEAAKAALEAEAGGSPGTRALEAVAHRLSRRG